MVAEGWDPENLSLKRKKIGGFCSSLDKDSKRIWFIAFIFSHKLEIVTPHSKRFHMPTQCFPPLMSPISFFYPDTSSLSKLRLTIYNLPLM